MTMPAPATTEDEALFEALRGGAGDALAALVRRHGRWVRSIVYAVLGRADRVDDVVQQVWTSAWQQAGTLRDTTRWRSWLSRLARNAAIDAGRAETRDRRVARPGDEVLEAIREAGPSPVEQVMLSEQQRLVLGAIRGLPAKYREPFVLRHVEDWSYRQIGEHLDLPVNTVETRLVRARRLLRDALEDKVLVQ